MSLLYCNYGIKSIVYRNFVKLSEEIETEIWKVFGGILLGVSLTLGRIKWGLLGGCLTCEELSGGYLQEMMGLVLVIVGLQLKNHSGN